MAYLEKDFQTRFNRWCKHRFNKTAAFELKLSRSSSLPFNALQEHQINALLNAKHAHLIFKIPDLGAQNPFDSFMLVKTPAYVVVQFHGGGDEFVMIDIDDFLKEQKKSDRKSLTFERAKLIGKLCQLA